MRDLLCQPSPCEEMPSKYTGPERLQNECQNQMAVFGCRARSWSTERESEVTFQQLACSMKSTPIQRENRFRSKHQKFTSSSSDGFAPALGFGRPNSEAGSNQELKSFKLPLSTSCQFEPCLKRDRGIALRTASEHETIDDMRAIRPIRLAIIVLR
jgi:hypothetical protein